MTSANYLLSDLYVSDDIYSPDVSGNCSSDDSDVEDDEAEDKGGASGGKTTNKQTSSSVEVKALCLPHRAKLKVPAETRQSQYPTITSDLEQRCREALKHVANVSVWKQFRM